MNDKTADGARKTEAELQPGGGQEERAASGPVSLHIDMKRIQTVQGLAREIRTKCEEVWGKEDVEQLHQIFRLWRQPGAADARAVLREALLVLSMLGEEHGAPKLVISGADRIGKILPPISLEWLKQYSKHLNFRLEAIGSEPKKVPAAAPARGPAGFKDKSSAGIGRRL
jgi:hypothetical protein